MSDEDKVVYSTDPGPFCVSCGKLREECICDQEKDDDNPQGPVTIRVERSGRRGKTVTIVEGVRLPHTKLQKLTKALKRRCGSGGTVQNGNIEIQGDRRATLISELTERGYTVQA